MLHQLIGNKHNDDLIFVFYLLSWNTCTIWMAHSYGNRIFKAIQQWQPGNARQVKAWHLSFTEDRVYGFFISGVWEWSKKKCRLICWRCDDEKNNQTAWKDIPWMEYLLLATLLFCENCCRYTNCWKSCYSCARNFLVYGRYLHFCGFVFSVWGRLCRPFYTWSFLRSDTLATIESVIQDTCTCMKTIIMLHASDQTALWE